MDNLLPTVHAAHFFNVFVFVGVEPDNLVVAFFGNLGLGGEEDSKVCAVIEEAYRLGALYDSWSDMFDNDIWMRAFKNTGVDYEFYTLRERKVDEVLPWDFIDIGVDKSFLKREWEAACKDKVSPI